MKALKKILLFGASALVFISCSDNDVNNPDVPQAKTPIRLSSSVSLLKSGSQNEQIVSGQEIGFYLNTTDETVFNIENEKLTADGNGNFTHNSMYYPAEGSSFVFTAYHPYSASGAVDGEIDFSIESDQSTKSAYLKSDLLYSKKTGVTKTANAVPLTFDHLLSKLTFTIIKGDGVEISKLSKIEISDVLSSIKMDIADGTLSSSSVMTTTVSAYGVTGGAQGVEFLSGSAAIIIPQTIQSDTKLLLITIDETVYSYTTTASLEFEGGKLYDFQIEINETDVKVTSTINDWDPGQTITGDGKIE